ncbi:hydrophobic surface binding protein A-domain-containing protein [Mycena epipterygia]|nr:hydrophobic surface binding protein A-domain-containing protein [Mycena epipterygia]
MVQLSRLLFAFSLLAASFTAPVKRTVAQIEADIAIMSIRVTTYANAISAITINSGLVQALAIHTAAINLESAVNQGTTDIMATGPIDDADATTIFNLLIPVVLTLLSALQELISKEPIIVVLYRSFIKAPLRYIHFQAAIFPGLTALFLADLETLETDISNFATALLDIVPADLKPEATEVLDEIISGFDAVIQAYE